MNRYIHIAYLTQAKDFLIVFQKIKDIFPRFTEKTNVKYYLLFHGAELALKSYLIYRGVNINILKQEVGHNLEKALNRCIAQSISTVHQIDNQFISRLKHMNKYYQIKQFEYPFIGTKIYVEHVEFITHLQRLISDLESEYRKQLK